MASPLPTQIKEVRWWCLTTRNQETTIAVMTSKVRGATKRDTDPGKLRRWLIAHDVHRGKINGHLTRMMLNISYKEKQTWRARRLRGDPPNKKP